MAAGRGLARSVADADVGIRHARLSPEGAEWARQQLARGLRELLTAAIDLVTASELFQDAIRAVRQLPGPPPPSPAAQGQRHGIRGPAPYGGTGT